MSKFESEGQGGDRQGGAGGEVVELKREREISETTSFFGRLGELESDLRRELGRRGKP